MALLQQDRLVSLGTPLGADVLLVETLEGSEGISSLFRFQLVLVSEKKDIALNALVGQNVTIAIELAGTKYRYLNGFVSRFSQGDVDSRVSHYYAEVVPWLWFLTRTTDCRIFQRKNVPDIIQQIFKDLGFTDFKLQLQGTFEPREYCVQYRETDFNFVSRLMEEEGIFYFFEHANAKHTLVIGNHPGVHQPCPNQAEARYGYLSGGNQEVDYVTRWHLEQEFEPGKYTLSDYYFQTPSNNLRVTAPSAVQVAGNSNFELYDYPGYYAKRFDGDDKAGKVRPDGERTAKLGIQGEEAFHKVVNGAGSCRAFVPGYKFELVEHRRADLNGPYVLTQVSHSATNNLGTGAGATYDNTFTAIPAAVPFRPARSAVKPVVQGAQTAVVVGLKGEEIDTDKYARVRVQFHWDREGKKDENSSCWVRVGTPWAGKQWGTIHIPRIGQEVIVAFLEGDPDQPIIVGSVYNAEYMPPYKLPDKKTQSGVKSRSSLKGTPDNFNELRFEDKKGSEEIYFHAEKNFTRVVENNDSLTVGSSKAEEGSQTIEIWKDRTETVKTGNEAVTVEKGNRTVVVSTGNDTHQIKMGNREVKIDMGNDTLTIKMGNQTTKLALGASTTEAMQSIELKVGQSSIKLDQMGVTIKGMMVTIEGQITTEVKGLMTTVKGDAMLTAKGGITMIN